MIVEKLKRKKPIVEMFREKKTLDIDYEDGDFLAHSPANFIGVDINDELLKIAKRKRYKLLKANATHIPFKKNSFEGAFCRYSIEHLTPAEAYQMTSEISCVLKKGGKAVIETELTTKKFWNTFNHIRSYPPGAIKKLITCNNMRWDVEK